MATDRKSVIHRVDPDGSVAIHFRDEAGRITASRRVSEHEAKVFAWALLADIDPDELEEAYRTPEEEASTTQLTILARLSSGPATIEEIALGVDLTPNEAAGRLMKLREQGLVLKIGSMGRSGSYFRITEDGLKSVRAGSRPFVSGSRTAA